MACESVSFYFAATIITGIRVCHTCTVSDGTVMHIILVSHLILIVVANTNSKHRTHIGTTYEGAIDISTCFEKGRGNRLRMPI